VTLTLNTECQMTVFAGNDEFTAVCRPEKLAGRRLAAILSHEAPVNSLVCIRSADALLFGEVWACWHEGEAVHALIALQEALTGLTELARFREMLAPAAERGLTANKLRSAV
jgi:hypothetical protein